MAGASTTGLGIQSPPHHVIHITNLPQPKTPSLYLLEENNGEAREKYLRLCVPLHKAALRGDWKTAKSILSEDEKLLTASITKGWETALHIAAGARHVHFVKELVQMMDAEDLALQDNKKNTALSFAAATGTVEIAEIMIQKNIFLPTIRGGEGMTPLYMAALLGQSEMAEYLYPRTHEIFDERDRNALFFTCVDTGLYDLAMKMLGNYTTLATVRNGANETALHVLARRPSEFANQSSGLWSRITNTFWKVAYKGNSKQTKALQLVQQLWKEILKLDDQVVMSLIKYPSQLLFDATRLGNFEFLAALLSAYPDLFWELDENKRSIIHVAVLHRHASIFNLVHEIGFFKDFITAMSDDEDNNILHLAAKLAPQNQLNLVSGAALQMQRELVWFEEVKKIVQPLSAEMKNKKGKTPRELFTSEHKGLLHKGESWMKNTAKSCMLVATIIATVVFSAAFSIPGGIADKTGAPNFVKETAFLIFAISDGVALFSSSTSMLMFLYILTSRYAENDFLKSLPLKLMVGLASLFISMTSMMIAFSTAFYLSCHYGLGFVSDFIFIFAFVPVVLFLFLQYPLLSDMFLSTYCSSLMFQPRKHMIQ
ncbi:PREDICTED: ankyrin [Prunus dulcis]|uniref:PREDICTED: ankyrin n=1 Tax=Prunus dulcis TaxID=3755 RepID=A0A5E4GIS4_PRUDU|nr:ankyrin repeat-containing protein NPR4-like [Prunus dulcis]VVA39636.1 PREDICTED: ankyrin [Prunus dulcis]